MPEENKFENILKSLRVRKGKAWTQAKTAQALGVSRRLYVGWENGDSLPSQSDLKNVAAMFGLSGEDEDTLYRAAAQVSPRIHNLPFPPNPFFTGREKHLEQLSTLLSEGSKVAISQPVSVSGLGGIGKTQLALEYAHRCYREKIYRAVLWVDAAERRTIEASYLSLAQLLGLLQKDEADTQQVIQAVRQWLEGHTDWLLIMDNADDLGLARSFFPVAHHGRILLTTRSQIVGKIARKLEVQEMEPEEGLRFLLLRARVIQEGDALDDVDAYVRKSASQLVALLGAHPLALEQAGAYVEETGISFDEYTKLFRERRNALMHRQGTLEGEQSEHRASVATTVKLSISRAIQRQPFVVDVISLLIFLQPDSIPEEVFRHDHEQKLFDALVFNESIAALLRYSIIKRNAAEKTFSIHRLVQAVALDVFEDKTPEAKRYWQERVVWGVVYAFPQELHDFRNWQLCERLLPHALSCITWDDVDMRGIQALLWRIAEYLDIRGRWTEAEPLLIRSLAASEQCYGPDHLRTAAALHDLAGFYIHHYGRKEEGRQMLERALAILEKKPEAGPLGVNRVLLSLAILHFKSGEDDESERLLLRVLADMEQHLGAEHLGVARILGMVASFYVHYGRYEQAEPLLMRAHEILSRQIALGNLDAQDPYNSSTLFGFTLVLHHQGKHEEAQEYSLQFTRDEERMLGPAHPEVIKYKKMDIQSLHSMGRHTEAEALEAEIRKIGIDD